VEDRDVHSRSGGLNGAWLLLLQGWRKCKTERAGPELHPQKV
jgi:hypothetical protein